MKPTGVFLRYRGRTHTQKVQPRYRTVRVGGRLRKFPIARFWKTMIGTGEYVHPITGNRFEVSRDDLRSWADKFARMREKGIEIPAPVDHSDKAEDNRGFVVRVKQEGRKLKGLIEVVGEDAVKMALRNRCSVYIDPQYRDEHGKNWGRVISHCAFTPKPVISGQGEFVPFAASRVDNRKVPVFYSRTKEQPMAARNNSTSRKGGRGRRGSLSPKQLKRARRLLNIDDDVEVSDGELLQRLVSHPKLVKAAKKGLQDEEEDDDEEDEEDDDDIDAANEEEDEEEEEESDEVDADDDEDDDEDDEDEEDDDEPVDDSRRRRKNKKNRRRREAVDEDEEDEDENETDVRGGGRKGRHKRIISRKRGRRVKALLAGLGLSRMPDRATRTLLKRSLKTERRRAIERGAITPEVDKALMEIFCPQGKLSPLALSRTVGSDDPLLFELYDVLRHNKPTFNRQRSSGQSIALGRTDVPSGTSRKQDKEIEQVVRETREYARRLRNGKKRDKDKTADDDKK